MNEWIGQYRTKLTDWWKALSAVQRLRYAGAAVLLVALAVTGWHFVASPDWKPLYTNLSPKTAGQITSQLTQMKVPYQLTNQGATILVPARDVDQVRVSLADQNIPSSGKVGLPAPLTFTLGETDQEIALTQLNNLEGTLAATIDSISGVHSSTVMINEPPPTLFGESQGKPTASVFVSLNPGTTLSAGQVRGIMNLVAHSVAGLSVDQVSVVDQSGNVLSAGVLQNPAVANVAGMTAAELADQNAVDSQIAANVNSMLTQMLGPGAAVVRVNATLNFNQATVTKTQYGKAVLDSQQIQKQSSSQAAGVPPSAVGVTGNVPTYPTAGSNGPSQSSKSTTISHWLVDTTRTSQTLPAGNITRLTVAVAVNQNLSAAQARALKNVIAAAAGVNFARGDQVTLYGQTFNRTAVNSALAAMKRAQLNQQIRQGVVIGVVLLVALLALLWIRRLVKRMAAQPQLVPGGVSVGAVSEAPRLSIAELLDEMRQKQEPSLTDVARKHLDELVNQDPEGVARLIRTWIQEDDL